MGLEERSQPKQVKKYVYTKECRSVPKTVCDNADQKFLKLSCVPSERKECTYHPEERCESVPKEHCYQIPYQVNVLRRTIALALMIMVVQLMNIDLYEL